MMQRLDTSLTQRINLSDRMRDLLSGLDDLIRENAVTFTIRLEPGLTLHVDAELLDIAIENLLYQTLSLAGEGGKVEVRSQRTEGDYPFSLVFEVARPNYSITAVRADLERTRTITKLLTTELHVCPISPTALRIELRFPKKFLGTGQSRQLLKSS